VPKPWELGRFFDMGAARPQSQLQVMLLLLLLLQQLLLLLLMVMVAVVLEKNNYNPNDIYGEHLALLLAFPSFCSLFRACKRVLTRARSGHGCGTSWPQLMVPNPPTAQRLTLQPVYRIE
jgi:hypothetical protein